MRLAMAIGDRRRYRLDEIAPRHFLQTAVSAGYDAESTRQVLHALRETAEAALERAIAAMPAGTHALVTDPVGDALRQRLAQIDLI